MKTVCHITTVHQPFDTRIYTKECAALAEAGYDVKLLVVNAPEAKSSIQGVEIVNVNVPFDSKWQRVLKAPRFARLAAEKLDAEAYHFHDPEFLPAALKMVRNGYTVIYDAHEDVPKQILTKDWIPRIVRGLLSSTVRRLENYVVRRLSAVITVVEGIVTRLRKYNSRIILVKNYPDVDTLPKPVDYSQKPRTICYVGDLTFIRGIAESVDAMAFVDAELIIAGKWSSPGLHEYAQQSKGYSRVADKGFVDKATVQQIFADTRVGLVLFHPAPNHMDALPNKLFEYLAAGIPVVASNFGWLKKIVEEYDCGIAVDPKNPKAIADAINQLLNDPAKAEQMGKNGRKAVEETFNWATEEAKLIQLYRDLIPD